MTYHLPYDIARCQGHDCPKRQTCLRHLALADVGPRTPFYGRLCGGADWTSYHPSSAVTRSGIGCNELLELMHEEPHAD
jgi:hypothetical protein